VTCRSESSSRSRDTLRCLLFRLEVTRVGQAGRPGADGADGEVD